MQKIQITEARKIAERIGAEQVVVIAFGDDHFAATSYGTTKALCSEVGKWIDEICADLQSGVMAPPSRPMRHYPYPSERYMTKSEIDAETGKIGATKSVGEKWSELYSDTGE